MRKVIGTGDSSQSYAAELKQFFRVPRVMAAGEVFGVSRFADTPVTSSNISLFDVEASDLTGSLPPNMLLHPTSA